MVKPYYPVALVDGFAFDGQKEKASSCLMLGH
jgi:hypothetical protein